jgi:inward rectifier potassium channel
MAAPPPPRRRAGADFEIRTLGLRRRLTEDIVHRVLLMPWWRFFALSGLGFLVLNATFAGLYLLQPGSLSGVRPGSFEDAFFFSVQTLGTIGYGAYAPATTYANVLVTIEAWMGLLAFAILTGLTFAKFARPTARAVFSDKVVIGHRDGARVLMVRMANSRHNNIVEAQVRLVLLVDHVTKEGERLRVPRVLPVVRDTNPFFRLTWTVSHPLDDESPFFGDDAFDRLREKNALLLVTLTGLDETIAQTVHARTTYELDDFVTNARFKDVLTIAPDGTRVIDYRNFHEVVAED